MNNQWPRLIAGVAKDYDSPEARRQALRLEGDGLFYQRHDHPNLRALCDHWSDLVNARLTTPFESGLAAASSVLRGLGIGKSIYMDKRSYYEVSRCAIAHSRRNLFRFRLVDLKDVRSWKDELQPGDVVWVDNPANWYLSTFDISAISSAAHRKAAILVVDTTLQPLHKALEEGADVTVTSLSKYPNMGCDMAGAVSSNDSGLMQSVIQERDLDGHVLSNEAAFRVENNLLTLVDRMRVLSSKVRYIADGLLRHDLVRAVNLPNLQECGGLYGGQLSFEVPSCNEGINFERYVGQQVHKGTSALHLMTTFGAPFTTVEHFGSNLRHRSGISREETNEGSLPDNIVRVGVGYQDEKVVLNQLLSGLDYAEAFHVPTFLKPAA